MAGVRHLVKRKKTPGVSDVSRCARRRGNINHSGVSRCAQRGRHISPASRKHKKTPGCFLTPRADYEDAGLSPPSHKRKKTSWFFPTSVFMHVWFRLCRSPFAIPDPMERKGNAKETYAAIERSGSVFVLAVCTNSLTMIVLASLRKVSLLQDSRHKPFCLTWKKYSMGIGNCQAVFLKYFRRVVRPNFISETIQCNFSISHFCQSMLK
jgi:hypothetical protein